MTFVTRLKLPKIKENLRPLIAADKELSSLFMAERLRKIGLQQHLREMYKPITEETKTIASKIEEGTKQAAQQAEVLTQNIQEGNVHAAEAARIAAQEAERAVERARVLQEIKSQPKIMEMITLLKNYPNVVKALVEEEDVELTNKDLEIIKLINKLPDEKLVMLSNYYKQEHELRSYKESPIDEDIITDASQVFLDLQQARGNRNKTDEILRTMTDADLDDLKQEIAKMDFKKLYKNKTLSTINLIKPHFVSDIYAIRRGMEREKRLSIAKPKAAEPKGEGIKFLPSNYKELKNKLLLAFGSYKAGNKNTFNEISAIMDELRRQGKISIKDIKGIFKLMKIK